MKSHLNNYKHLQEPFLKNLQHCNKSNGNLRNRNDYALSKNNNVVNNNDTSHDNSNNNSNNTRGNYVAQLDRYSEITSVFFLFIPPNKTYSGAALKNRGSENLFLHTRV